jgi:hypothetical protein
MADSPLVIKPIRRDRRLQLAFLSAVTSLAAAFAASSAPIPLFNLYRAEDGFTPRRVTNRSYLFSHKLTWCRVPTYCSTIELSPARDRPAPDLATAASAHRRRR